MTESRIDRRLLIALAIASAAHAWVLFGIRRPVVPPPTRHATSLAVTLVRKPAPEAPHHAEFRATSHQIGAGTPASGLTEGADGRRVPAVPGSTEAREVAHAGDRASPRADPTRRRSDPLLLRLHGNWEIDAGRQPDRPAPATSNPDRSLTLGAEFRPPLMDPSGIDQPPVLDAVNATASLAAAYARAWQARIERVGDRYAARLAHREKLSGSLILSVWLSADGRVERIELERSSGSPALDAAAKEIVHRAMPFPPFPEGLQRVQEHLVITRTWRFGDGD